MEARITLSATFTDARPAPSPVAVPASDTIRQPRARGATHLRLHRARGATRLADLRMAGASKLLFPRGDALTAVSLNTSGGVTGGDRFRLRAHLGTACHAVLTTQAAERLYKAQSGERGIVANRIVLEPRARLFWLPQETIVFDGASVLRGLQVDMAGDAELLAVEPLAFGRVTSGERLRKVGFEDRWNVRRGGELIFADRLRLSSADELDAHAGGAAACASVLFVSPRAASCLEALRALLPASGAAVLLREDVLFARVLAEDAFVLRQSLVPAVEYVTGGSLPRTWMI